jgi:RNA polymerase II subunit A-like phosphatase
MRSDVFFEGAGDINGAFLPPTPQSPTNTRPAPSSGYASPTSTASTTAEGEVTSEEDGLLMQKKLLDDISEARPLAKLQEQLDSDTDNPPEASAGIGKGENEAVESDTKPDQSLATQPVQRRKPLLNNIDNELDRLSHVHRFLLGAYH